MGQHPQLNLRVVGVHQQAVPSPGKELPQFPTNGSAHRDVLQIRLRTGDPPGTGLSLVKGGVHPSIGPNNLQQAVTVGGLQFRHGSVAQHLIHHRVEMPQLLQNIGVGGPTALSLFAVGQAQLIEKCLSQLLGRVDVELVPHLFNDGIVEGVHLSFQLLAVGFNAVPIHVKANVLHLGQHKGQGDFNGGQQLLLTIFLHGLAQSFTQLRHGGSQIQLLLREIRQGHVVLSAKALHVVPRGRGVQQIPSQDCIHADVLHPAAQLQSQPVQGFGVVGVLFHQLVLEKGPQKRLVRLHPMELSLVGKDQAGKLALLPVGVEIGLPGIL